jgi:Cys-tRNA(Pro)/Cys-tRNA(Cys) deacylase
MADIKTNVMRTLQQKRIKYIPHEYPHGDCCVDGLTVARLINKSEEQVYKTLVTRGASKANYVFVIPVSSELDLKKAAKCVGEKSIEMIHVDELLKLTGYVRGGCSPIGMKKQFKTVFSDKIDLLETVIVSAGKIGFQVELTPRDLIMAVGGITADITA